jgi:hypothetical protein
MPHVVANNECQRASHNHAVFLMEEFIVHLKLCGSQTNLQQPHGGFDLRGRPFLPVCHRYEAYF